MGILLYDCEVFKHWWLVSVLDPYQQQFYDLTDSNALVRFYNKHKDDVWVSYNGRHYDKYIVKSIMLGHDPYQINDWIINQHQEGWAFDNKMNNIPLYDYDCMKINDGGLKSLEAYMGLNIHETDVDFDLDRELTDEEKRLTIDYCHDDVLALMEVFIERKADFDAHMGLITEFGLPLSAISKTQAQICAMVLDCSYHDWTADEFDVTFVDTIRLGKYEFVKEWFVQKFAECKEAGAYTKGHLNVDIAGVPHIIALGGAHGARPMYHASVSDGIIILHIDVSSYYPSLNIRYGFISRSSNSPQKYTDVYYKRLALKKAGKKKEQAPLKIVLNAGGFGINKDKNSAAYDPVQANNTTTTGQLGLVDLIDKLEVIDGFVLIQSNTDGLIVSIPDTDEAFEQVDDICYEWEQRVGVGLEFDQISEIYQFNVNNYCFKFVDGKIERKGGWLQESNRLKNNLTIVNTAMVEYLMNGVPVEKTIGECDDLNLFQMVVKVSSKYECGWHNGERLTDKTFRIYASVDTENDSIYKQKSEGATKEKFANTPDHLIIHNTSLKGVTPAAVGLDKQWYIDLAKKRLGEFYSEGKNR